MKKSKMDLMLEYVERTKHFELSDELENALMDLYTTDPSFFTDRSIELIEFLNCLLTEANPEVFIEALKLQVNFEGGF